MTLHSAQDTLGARFFLPDPSLPGQHGLRSRIGWKHVSSNCKTRNIHCADEPHSANVHICCLLSNYVFYIPNPCVLGTRPVLPCKNCYCCKLELVRARSMLGLQSLQFICHWLLTVASVSLGLPMQLELSCLQVWQWSYRPLRRYRSC